MIRYITRHGQVTNAKFLGAASFPLGEIPLSPLGREQAMLLGKRMRELNFHGHILCSPYLRTLETAEIIAEMTGTLITPFAPIREIFKSQETADAYRGSTMEEIRQKFTHIDPKATLPYPWWTPVVEEHAEVCARVQEGLAQLAQFNDEELLFVGHGASVAALLDVYNIPQPPRPHFYNCSLSAIDPNNADFKPFCYDMAHIPYEKATNNYRTREEIDLAFFAEPYAAEIELPEGYEELRGEKILHIGDTNSEAYPYYKKLFSLVKPDIILHTGDMADEVKVGRIPGTEYEYLTKIKVLLRMMQESGARRLIIVPGNNDLPQEIQRLAPNAEVYPENTVLTFSGVPCLLSHQVPPLPPEFPYAFYGHSIRFDAWRYEMNAPLQPCRFNAARGSYVCTVENNRFVRFKPPHL